MYVVFGKDNCPYCDKLKETLFRGGMEYNYINLSQLDSDASYVLRYLLREELNLKTVPQVFKLVGGYEDFLLMMKYTPKEEQKRQE